LAVNAEALVQDNRIERRRWLEAARIRPNREQNERLRFAPPP